MQNDEEHRGRKFVGKISSPTSFSTDFFRRVVQGVELVHKFLQQEKKMDTGLYII
jgi:hypothetical protein